jgi:hypothetical protein
MKRRIVFYQLAIMAVTLLLVVPNKDCNAIPAFARKYQISCQVCHSPAIPRLKSFGEEFAYNGYRMTKYESPRYFIPTGDEKLSLFRELPLAVRLDGFASYNFNKEEKTDFSAPFIAKILSGGELSDKLSYYFYFLMNEGGSIIGLEDAFLIYHDLFKTGANFYIGQFQASDPLFKSELRYTFEEYRIFDAAPGNSSVNLKYERGVMLEKGFSSGTTLVGEIVNGSGFEPAYASNVFDKDKYKNFMLTLTQTIGKKVNIGFFGYTGKEELNDNNGPFTSNIAMIGPNIKVNFDDKLIIGAQFVRRSDSKVYVESDVSIHNNVITEGGFGEVTYSPKGDMSKWYLTGLFNWVESEMDDLDYRSATVHAGYLLRRNVRLVSEFTWQFSGNPYGRVNVGFVSAF